MWMQLGSRAFIAGTNQRLQKKEGTERPHTSSGSSNSLNQIETSRQLGHRPMILNLDKANTEEESEKEDCVYLTNPSMNDLMAIIKTASSKGEVKRVIIVDSVDGKHTKPQPKDQRKIEASCSSLNSKGEDFDQMNRERLQIPGCQCLKSTHPLRAVSKPQVRPPFVEGNTMVRKLSTSPKKSQAAEPELNRAYSADDVRERKLRTGSTQSLSMKVKSEGTLVTMPGIDTNLSQQMALLKPLYEQSSISSSTDSLDRIQMRLFTRRADIESDVEDGCESICNWSLGLSKEDIVQSQVDEAKQFVQQAVQAAAIPDGSSPVPQSNYWINLVHCLLFIFCLRGR